jgi:hypothetical protein
MFRRGMTKLVLSMFLTAVLLMSSVPAMADGGARPGDRWQGLWSRVFDWFGESVSEWTATLASLRIEPSGRPAGAQPDPVDSAKAETSAGIDPNGEH